MPTLVPATDRAPSLASRVVTIHATDVTEGAPAPDHFVFSLPCALRVPADDVILRPGGVKVRLVDGRAQVRLPVYTSAVQTVDGSTDWVVIVKPSWGDPYPIRVPAGTSAISLADLPSVRPLTRREQQYAITSVGVTVTEGTQAGGSASYTNGNLDLKIQVPAFRPQTVYPYIDQTADARAQHYEQRIRADLDDRLEEVTTAYELAVEMGFTGTIEEWLTTPAGIKGEKGDQGDDSTVPGPPNVLSIGTVTTGAAGSQAAATITGTSPEQVLGLTIPRGDKGEKGDKSTVPGPTGKTAYEYAVDAGFTGTEEEFAAAQLPDTITWQSVENKPTEFPAAAHRHGWADLDDVPAEFPPAKHTHAQADIGGLTAALAALTAATTPTAWTNCTVRSGFAANQGNVPQVQREGKRVQMRRGINNTGLSAGGSFDVLDIPEGFRPEESKYIPISGSSAAAVGMAVVSPSGAVTVRTSATLSPYYLLDALTWNVP